MAVWTRGLLLSSGLLLFLGNQLGLFLGFVFFCGFVLVLLLLLGLGLARLLLVLSDPLIWTASVCAAVAVRSVFVLLLLLIEGVLHWVLVLVACGGARSTSARWGTRSLVVVSRTARLLLRLLLFRSDGIASSIGCTSERRK